MTVLGLGAGLVVGMALNWAAQFLPLLASPHLAKGRTTTGRFGSALWRVARTWLGDGADRARSTPYLAAAVELVTALLYAVLAGGPSVSGGTLLIAFIYAFFVLVALIDVNYRLVPNWLVFPAIGLVAILAIVLPDHDVRRVFLGGAFGLGIFGLTAWLRPGDLGWGDVKLAVLIGMVFQFPNALWALATGILAGGLTAIAMILSHRGGRSSRMPYAPFLCFGALVALFYNPFGWLR